VIGPEERSVRRQDLVDQLSLFRGARRHGSGDRGKEGPAVDPSAAARSTISSSRVRSANCLKAETFYYIGDAVQRTETEASQGAHLGRKVAQRDQGVLGSRGLTLA